MYGNIFLSETEEYNELYVPFVTYTITEMCFSCQEDVVLITKNEFSLFSKLFTHGRLFYMVLSDLDIKKAIATSRIVITPTLDFTTQLGSCSIDLRLGDAFRVFDYSRYPYIDPQKKDYSNEITKKVQVTHGENFI